MAVYRLGTSSEMIALAQGRGWVVPHPEQPSSMPETTALPRAVFRGRDGEGELVPVDVQLDAAVEVRLPDVRVHGRNLSLIIDDWIFPGGFAHSFWPSPAWQQVGPRSWRHVPAGITELPHPTARLLGVVSHFGHFFVDALERLLRLMADDTGEPGVPWLVSDANLLGLRPVVDAHGAIPQVAQLIRVLGGASALPRLQRVPLSVDVHVRELRMWTLQARKPAVPARAFVQVRSRLSAALQDDWAASQHAKARPLFVGRTDVRKRLIVDQAPLLEVLQGTYGMDTVMPELLAIEEAMRRFGRASGVLLPLGSAKFNLIFCRPGTPVVCITPRGYARQNGGVVTMLRHLCHALMLPLAFYEVDIQRCEPLVNSNLLIAPQDIDPMLDLIDDLRQT